ncbi:branched-chain amino acid aminotransferase 1, mitochondrial-like [Aristolochia californica]|uniref:branched-chain amino acid aminotransferase 1, mitochondrial-like n=1 Tax=Aristolochia californica TaxID=171875 RepID=UPI0035DD3466
MLCMSATSIDQFVEAVKQTAIANKRWVPPIGKGALYLRPLLLGSGAVLGLAPAPEYMFVIYASPVGNYFKEGLSPINLFIEPLVVAPELSKQSATMHLLVFFLKLLEYLFVSTRPVLVLKAQLMAKRRGFSDVLLLHSVNKRNIEEAASCNVFIVKDNNVSTPSKEGTILSAIMRKSIIEIARDHGYEVISHFFMLVERSIPVEELLEADEAFCTGTAVVVAPVGSITYRDKRIEYRTGAGTVSQTLYRRLTSIQMGLVEDIKGWTVEIE